MEQRSSRALPCAKIEAALSFIFNDQRPEWCVCVFYSVLCVCACVFSLSKRMKGTELKIGPEWLAQRNGSGDVLAVPPAGDKARSASRPPRGTARLCEARRGLEGLVSADYYCCCWAPSCSPGSVFLHREAPHPCNFMAAGSHNH